MKQTTLAPVMITREWSEHHKLRLPKKQWLDYYETPEQTFESIIEKTFDKVLEVTKKEAKPIVAWSGGKDGGVVLHKLLKKNLVGDVFYIRTNTGVQATEDFVIDSCTSLGLRLHIREPTPLAYSYVALVCEIGFPGPTMHDMVMKILKYNTMFKFVTDPMFRGYTPVLMSGVRKFESKRRKFNYQHPINCDSKKLWFSCPEFYSSDAEIYRYFIENGIKRSSAYDFWDSSMECECGTFAQHGEMDAIKLVDPKRAEFFKDLTEFVKKHGSDLARKHLDWGGDSWTKEEVNQVITNWFGEQDYEHIQKVSQMICGSECGAGTMRGMMNY